MGQLYKYSTEMREKLRRLVEDGQSNAREWEQGEIREGRQEEVGGVHNAQVSVEGIAQKYG
jgi:hypothetical protein